MPYEKWQPVRTVPAKNLRRHTKHEVWPAVFEAADALGTGGHLFVGNVRKPNWDCVWLKGVNIYKYIMFSRLIPFRNVRWGLKMTEMFLYTSKRQAEMYEFNNVWIRLKREQFSRCWPLLFDIVFLVFFPSYLDCSLYCGPLPLDTWRPETDGALKV